MAFVFLNRYLDLSEVTIFQPSPVSFAVVCEVAYISLAKGIITMNVLLTESAIKSNVGVVSIIHVIT